MTYGDPYAHRELARGRRTATAPKWLDTYLLVTEEQATLYGGVVDWRIEESALHLDLTEAASRAIGASGFRTPFRSQTPASVALLRPGAHHTIAPVWWSATVVR